MKINTKRITATLIIFFLFSCKSNESEDKSDTKVKDVSSNINISMLLDLSDRISPEKYPNPAMEYYLRDVGYINSVAEAFVNHVRAKRVRQVNDRIQLFFDPTPFNPQINAISKELKIEVNRNNISNDFISKIKKSYATEPLEIYKLAIKDNNYIGSDTWKFFKSKINDYCIEDGYRNILVILTDGYIYYKNSQMKIDNTTSYLVPELIKANGLNTPDWSEKMINRQLEFIKANNDLSNLEILVLGINPDPKNPYEEDVIKAYWTKWFEAMKVKRYQIRSSELPSDADKVIKDFINNK